MVIRNTIVDINSDVKVEKSNIGDRVGFTIWDDNLVDSFNITFGTRNDPMTKVRINRLMKLLIKIRNEVEV